MRTIHALHISGLLVVSTSLSCDKLSKEQKLSEKQKMLGELIGDLKELNLSSHMKTSLPNGMRAGSANLQSGEGKLSAEACRMRNELRRVQGEINVMRNLLCKIEAHSSDIQFGNKYTASWGEGESAGSWGIYVDNLDKERLNIYVCGDGKLNQKYVITGGDDQALRGTLKSTRQWTDTSTGRVQDTEIGAWFDTGVRDSSRRKTGLHTRIRDTAGNDGTVGIFLDVNNTGTSQFSLQFTSASTSYSNVATAKADADGGMILFGDSYGTYASAFNSTGYLDELSARAATQVDGSLHVTVADLPGIIPSALSPGEFAATDWDCADGQSIHFNEGGRYNNEIAACQTILQEGTPWENCSDPSYGSNKTVDSSSKITTTEADPAAAMEARVFGE